MLPVSESPVVQIRVKRDAGNLVCIWSRGEGVQAAAGARGVAYDQWRTSTDRVARASRKRQAVTPVLVVRHFTARAGAASSSAVTGGFLVWRRNHRFTVPLEETT
jgi:hypothetical protein